MGHLIKLAVLLNKKCLKNWVCWKSCLSFKTMGWYRWWFLFAGSKFVGSKFAGSKFAGSSSNKIPATQLTTWSCPGSFCSSKPDQHVVLVSEQSNGKTHVLWNQIKSNQVPRSEIIFNLINYWEWNCKLQFIPSAGLAGPTFY